jgi:hypothetical protein
MTVLDPGAADMLAKLLGMLGSDHDGERAAAALKAHQLVKARGLTWKEIIQVERPTTDQLIHECLDGEDHLSTWEAGFVRSIRGRQYLTEKQLGKLHELAEQVRQRRCRP